MYDIQHCFICRPSASTVSEDAGIEPRTVATIRHWLSYALTTLLDFIHLLKLKCAHQAGSLKMNTALEYSTRVVQEGGRRCKKSTLNDLVHLTPLRIPLMNPPIHPESSTSVPFTLTTPNLALTHTKRITVFVPEGRIELGFSSPQT